MLLGGVKNIIIYTIKHIGGLSLNKHIIKAVKEGSIAEELGLEPGDAILKINDTDIEDIFDYQFLTQDDYIEVLVETKDGEECILEIDKDYDEDLGVEFDNGLMSEYHSCHNKCIFCFIDQMPPGMRDTLYFKDDDTRLSFLQGNYVTLTNLSDKDVDRLIRYRLEPINVSFQTMNPELRCKMLNNRFAGDALKKADRLYEAGITMNGQIVLCKGVNDGDELRYSLEKLLEYYPVLQSVSVVPVGLSKYRDGLYPLEPFSKEDAIEVIDIIEGYQREAIKRGPYHFVHASDEWYLLAGRELPEEDRYDGYLQIENGVGMIRSFKTEFEDALLEFDIKDVKQLEHSRKVTIATGRLAAPSIDEAASKLSAIYSNLDASVVPIRNDFFGEMITVAGLITAKDLIAQLQDLDLGDALLIPECMLRAGTETFLDDLTLTDVQNALHINVTIVKSSGMDFVKAVLGFD